MGLALRDAGGGGPARAAFLCLPSQVYRGDPRFTASPRSEVEASLDRPEFRGRQRLLVALRDGVPQARLVARLSPTLRGAGGGPLGPLGSLGMIGFFEALEGSGEAVAALFGEAVSWLRAQGAGEIVGPMDGDTWHRYRLNAGPREAPPFLLEPYNPPYYAGLWEESGFEVLERYLSQRVAASAVVAHCARRAAQAEALGYRLRPLDLGRFDRELRTLYRLSLAIFAGNTLYTPIEEERFLALYRGARALLDPRLVWFAHAPPGAPGEAGEEIGFLFAYPDRIRAVAAMRGRRDLLAKLRFLRRRDDFDAVDFKTLGVLAAHRRSGVAAALFHRGHAEALAMGKTLAYHCLFREGNPSGDLDGGAGEVLRRYYLYRWEPPPPDPLPHEVGEGGTPRPEIAATPAAPPSPSPAPRGRGSGGGGPAAKAEGIGGEGPAAKAEGIGGEGPASIGSTGIGGEGPASIGSTGPGGEGLFNVTAILRDVARRRPHRTALVLGRELVSFGELWERIDRTSSGLRRLGLGPGDRAIVLIPMSIDLYVAMLALLKIGAVAVFVDPWVGRRQIAAFAAFAAPRAFLGVGRSHLLRWLDPRLRRIPCAVTSGARIGGLPAPHTLRELGREPGDGRIFPVAADDPALITFTSGSSGEPKGANRTHRFLAAQGAALAAEFPAHPGDVDMPMFPVFALNNLAAGVTSIVPKMDFRRVDEVDAGTILAQMLAYGVTTATASPPFFDRLAAALATSGARPPLRRILTGGAPVSDEQLRRWRAALPGVEIQVVYGSTEAEPVAHVAAEERLAAVHTGRPQAPGYCAGRPGDRVRCRVVRIHAGPIALGPAGWAEWEVPPGEIGELVVAGEHVGRDYYRNPRAVADNKIVERDGAAETVWHRMGDNGSFDSEGRFWLAGRVHSTIRRRRPGREEELLHAQLVEQAAGVDDPRIRRAAVVGLSDGAEGERAVLVLETVGGDAAARELKAEVARRLAQSGLEVDEIVLTKDPLPVDPRHNSKIDYPRLRERLLRGRPRRGAGAGGEP